MPEKRLVGSNWLPPICPTMKPIRKPQQTKVTVMQIVLTITIKFSIILRPESKEHEQLKE